MEYGTGYRATLKREFARRKGRNERYSLRAFSRDLGLNPATLSQVLAGKRHLSTMNAQKVAAKLPLSPRAVKQMLIEIRGVEGAEVAPPDESYTQLEDDTFLLIADWHHFAILNLAKLQNQKASPKWIAARLGLEEWTAGDALNRLQRLKLLAIENGRLKRTSSSLSTSRDVSSAAIRQYHRQILEMAARSLEEVDVAKRDISAITMPLHPARLLEAKDMLLNFKRRFAAWAEEEAGEDVYTLSLQLFPVTRPVPTSRDPAKKNKSRRSAK